MIIGKCFEGDNDEELKMYQHSCYEDLLRHWIELSGRKLMPYRSLPEWNEVVKQWQTFRERGMFDHRCIQVHHDLIAQRYRMIQDNPSYIMFTGNKGWEDFFHREASGVVADSEMLKLFVTALACANMTEGYDAEDSLLGTMQAKYGIGKMQLTAERGENMKPVKILEVGAEGGGITLFGWKTDQGEWCFLRETDERTLQDMMPEEDRDGLCFYAETDSVTGWGNALELLSKYPWQCLSPHYVHPEFASRVLGALKDAPSEYRENIDWSEWDAVCAGKDPFGKD